MRAGLVGRPRANSIRYRRLLTRPRVNIKGRWYELLSRRRRPLTFRSLRWRVGGGVVVFHAIQGEGSRCGRCVGPATRMTVIKELVDV
jgi:hypothetical protein